jgi:hypothetical protein
MLPSSLPTSNPSPSASPSGTLRVPSAYPPRTLRVPSAYPPRTLRVPSAYPQPSSFHAGAPQIQRLFRAIYHPRHHYLFHVDPSSAYLKRKLEPFLTQAML